MLIFFGKPGRKRRDALRAVGLPPIQILLPDMHHARFAEECRRQALIVAAADAADHNLWAFLNDVLADVGAAGKV
ncbi:DUF3018 family protein [Sphingomonas populi]|uniref:DUF3018 family protein n=1 Tax=Sphingomonas populi TaxID=2484750 RepID=A0A4Q6XTR7_9SPHN|nr:antitoxin MazE-like protein [Sphingomonas populi]RZF63923.1 DUF3018 family protein [Sphingomonas populi]